MVAAKGKGRRLKKPPMLPISLKEKSWIEGFLCGINYKSQVKEYIQNTLEAFEKTFHRKIKKGVVLRIHRQQNSIISTKIHLGCSTRIKKESNPRGRPPKTNIKQDQLIRRVVQENNRLPWSDIQQNLKANHNIDIDERTIIRRANEVGIKGYVPIEKPLLNEEKAQKRLNFAKNMLKKLEEDPELLYNLVFTDETKIRIFETQTGGNVHVKCKQSERLFPENVSGKVKYGGGGICYWGCITYHFIGDLH